MADLPGYRFGDFVVSRRRRQVLRAGTVVPLIPRYFDLLVLLIERRPSVVTRRDVFDLVWGDVIVSDGALTQAVRTLRRTLGDDAREPVFIRTVSRHGYSFVYGGVEEVADDRVMPPAPASRASPDRADAESTEDHFASLIDRLLEGDAAVATIEDRRDAAQQLHELGTATALARLVARPGHAEGLALLRDTRWDVAGAGSVPLWGQPEGLAAARRLIAWRARDAARVASRRWVQAAGGAAATGALAGLVGGTLLAWAPGSRTPASAVAVFMVLGASAGFAGAAGVAAGIAAAEAEARSRRTLAIVVGGAAGGLTIGWLLQIVTSWTLDGLFGLRVEVGGPVEGLSLGASIAVGYALASSPREGGIATPRGWARWRTAAAAGLSAALAAVLLSLSGHSLVGGIVHAVAQAAAGSQVSLAPLGAWLGEAAFGPVTRTLVAAAEGGLFGFGLTWGLTRRRGRMPAGRVDAA